MLDRNQAEEFISKMNGQLTVNFHLSEFMCHDGTAVPRQYYANVIELAIHINSSYRTKRYNAMIGGTTFSKHLIGQAADITSTVFRPKEIADTIERLISFGKMHQGGLGRYANFVHYDIRGTKARWGHH